MKYFLLIFFVISANKNINAQRVYDSIENKITFTEVVQSPNKSKDQLHSLFTEWFAKTYNSSNNVIQLNNKEEGKIIGKGAFLISPIYEVLNKKTPTPLTVKYTISVIVKDGRYKYEISSIKVSSEGKSNENGIEEYYKSDKNKIYEQLSEFIKSKKIIEQYVEITLNFNKAIIAETELGMLSLINLLKKGITENKKEDW